MCVVGKQMATLNFNLKNQTYMTIWDITASNDEKQKWLQLHSWPRDIRTLKCETAPMSLFDNCVCMDFPDNGYRPHSFAKAIK